jgi:hypothetical protein
MVDELRVILEIGRKRKVVTGAMEWPGSGRYGTSENDGDRDLAGGPGRA